MGKKLDPESTPVPASNDGDTDAERRTILARLGKMAALTGPAVVTLMLSTRASAASP
jgi:hypothetical protein